MEAIAFPGKESGTNEDVEVEAIVAVMTVIDVITVIVVVVVGGIVIVLRMRRIRLMRMLRLSQYCWRLANRLSTENGMTWKKMLKIGIGGNEVKQIQQKNWYKERHGNGSQK